MSYLNKATNTICGALPIGMMTWLIYILVKHNDYSDCVIPAMFGAVFIFLYYKLMRFTWQKK